MPLPVVERATEPGVQADELPALPAPAPAPTPAVTAPCGARRARPKVAADHRARTGSDIDTETLRARLGVPSPMAEAIAAQLA